MVGDDFRQMQIVGHQQNRQPPLVAGFTQTAGQANDRWAVQSAGRFVKEEYFRTRRQTANQTEPLLLPHGQRAGVPLQPIAGELAQGQQFLQLGIVGRRRGLPLKSKGALQIIEHRTAENKGLLRNQRHFPTQLQWIVVTDIPPIKQHLAAARLFQTIEQPYQGALASARRADDHGNTTGLQSQVNIPQYGYLFPLFIEPGFAKPVELQYRFARSHHASCLPGASES